MKVRLLKKLRRRGQDQINIYSVTKTDGIVTGMSVGYDDDKYSKLFCFGDTKEEVKKKAERIYIEDYIKGKMDKIK